MYIVSLPQDEEEERKELHRLSSGEEHQREADECWGFHDDP